MRGSHIIPFAIGRQLRLCGTFAWLIWAFVLLDNGSSGVTIITIMNIHNRPKLLGVANLNDKGQLVIPKDAREYLGIGPGDRVMITTAPNFKAIIIARPEDFEEKLQNMMANTVDALGAVRKELKK